MRQQGTFKGWLPQRGFGFIRPDDLSADIFLHSSEIPDWSQLRAGGRIEFETRESDRGRVANEVTILRAGPPVKTALLPQTACGGGGNIPVAIPRDADSRGYDADDLASEEIEELDTQDVDVAMLSEISTWKREAKAEDTSRYFWHGNEVDQIARRDAGEFLEGNLDFPG
jgi:cold shock CspA family protein